MRRLFFALCSLFLLLTPVTNSFAQVNPGDPMDSVLLALLQHADIADDLNEFQGDLWIPYGIIMTEFASPNPDPGVIYSAWTFDLAPAIVYTTTLGNHIRRVSNLRNNFLFFHMAGTTAVVTDPGNTNEVLAYALFLDLELDVLNDQLDTISNQLSDIAGAGQGFAWGLGGPQMEIGNHNRSYTRLSEMRTDNDAFIDFLMGN